MQRNYRSIQQQTLILLEAARLLEDETPLDRAEQIRQRLGGAQLGDTVAEVRAERET